MVAHKTKFASLLPLALVLIVSLAAWSVSTIGKNNPPPPVPVIQQQQSISSSSDDFRVDKAAIEAFLSSIETITRDADVLFNDAIDKAQQGDAEAAVRGLTQSVDVLSQVSVQLNNLSSPPLHDAEAANSLKQGLGALQSTYTLRSDAAMMADRGLQSGNTDMIRQAEAKNLTSQAALTLGMSAMVPVVEKYGINSALFNGSNL